MVNRHWNRVSLRPSLFLVLIYSFIASNTIFHDHFFLLIKLFFQLDEDLAQFRSQLGMEEAGRDDNEQSNDFLSQIAQMDDDECEKVYDARVKYT